MKEGSWAGYGHKAAEDYTLMPQMETGYAREAAGWAEYLCHRRRQRA